LVVETRPHFLKRWAKNCHTFQKSGRESTTWGPKRPQNTLEAWKCGRFSTTWGGLGGSKSPIYERLLEKIQKGGRNCATSSRKGGWKPTI